MWCKQAKEKKKRILDSQALCHDGDTPFLLILALAFLLEAFLTVDWSSQSVVLIAEA